MRTLLVLILILSFRCGSAQNRPALIIHFDFNRYALTHNTIAQLDSFIHTQKGAVLITLYGHCDSVGGNNYNDWLSKKRAHAIQVYLGDRGFVHYEMIAGFGKRKPLNDNSTVDERSLNRRVEIYTGAPTTANIAADSIAPQLEKQLMDTANKIGNTIIVKNLNFYGGMHHLLPQSNPVAQALLVTMRDNPGLVIDIEGHICCQPDSGDGMDFETGTMNLSENRAKFIYDYLVENGIDSARLSYRGFGHQFPLTPYPETTTEQQDNNRRVEIKIIRR